MMPGPYLDTPRTNDASHLTNGLDRLAELSPEKSFVAPQQNRDLISQMRNARQGGLSLKTPRAGGRDPLRILPNGNQAKPEFTPLLKSATKNNIARRMSSRKKGDGKTPDFLRHSYIDGTTPALPKFTEFSQIQSENTSSSAGNANEYSAMPQNISSSAQSTPLAQLPARDAGAVINDGNMMTLREQENIIDKIEKENFGLKMKIHFLEEALSKRGGDFNQAALKENTDLKVNRVTMQRELHKFKKNIAQAERDAEIYRLQLEEYRERIRRKQADDTIRMELENLRTQLTDKESEIDELQGEYQSLRSKENGELEKLREDNADLQAELREKDRQIEDREDQIDSLKINASKEGNVAEELEQDLEAAKQQIEELRQSLERAGQDIQEAKEEREDAVDDKRKAEEDLDELRDEMANKSFTTKGLSRQLEEKTNKLEDDLHDLQERYASLQIEVDGKIVEEKKLQDRVRELEREGAADSRSLRQNLELTQQQRDTFERKLIATTKQAESFQKDLQIKHDEKDLLQSRHDALTTESSELQKDLAKLQKTVKELEGSLEEERRQSAQNDNILRSQQQAEAEHLNEQIDNLHREVNFKVSEHASDMENWEAQKRSLEVARDRAEEKATGLQRTVDKLRDVQGSSSGQETQLQEALESEKQRHLQEEKVLSRQIEELNQDLVAKRNASENNRNELNNAKEELRISIREQAGLNDKVAELEDEIEVLQADIEQEHEFAQQLQKRSSETADVQLQKLKKEKQSLQEGLATINLELQDMKRALQIAESDRDDLENKLEKASKSADDTFNVDQEKRELKRAKQKLEKELIRLKTERDALAEAKVSLEDEINAEIERASAEENRLNAEMDLLRNKQITGSEAKDRDLLSAKNKAARFEIRVRELEDLLENQSKLLSSPATDISRLKHDLVEARDNETAAAKRETELKSVNRDLKMHVNDLERELHAARLAQYKAASPSVSPPPSQSKELSQARRELFQAREELEKMRSELKNLKRAERRGSDQGIAHGDLRHLGKTNSLRAETRDTQVLEKEEMINDLRAQLEKLKNESPDVRKVSHELGKRDHLIADLKAQLMRRNDEKGGLDELSIKLSSREDEVFMMKNQLKQLRQERVVANQKTENIENELDLLQSRYEGMLEQLTNGKHGIDEVREKEMKGLIKEITWLKAKCKREERLRKDLAWSKRYLEQGEAMRLQCNQIDLRIIREMGVDLDKRKYEKPLRPVQKLRAGVFAVIAAIRMSNMEEQWSDAKKIGDQLRTMRMKQKKQQSNRRTVHEV